MNRFWVFVFIISCFCIFYNYAGYGILLYFINLFKRKKYPSQDVDLFPSVSFIVAAFNEENCIEKKIINSLEQDYPPDKIEFLFITDGSTDETPAIVKRFPPVHLLHLAERKGKSAALNRAVENSKNDILIFSDANTLLNKKATKYIASQYENEKVGGVAGEKKVMSSLTGHEVGQGEGLYWKYESFLKKVDSEFYSVVGAAGELFSVKRTLYEMIPEETILDDFVVSLKVAQKGYRIAYEPAAFASELPSDSLADEQKRKIRIAAGGFQAMYLLRSLFLFWRHPRLSFLYISHRVMRWTLSPLSLVLAFISNAVLAFQSDTILYKVLFIVQLSFYTLAAIPAFISSKGKKFKLLNIAYYFVFMNISVIRGFFRFLRGRQPAIWEKAKRQQVAEQ